MGRNLEGIDRSVPLPPGLAVAHIRQAVRYIEKEAEKLLDLYYEQANIFSALIGILGIRALHSFSPYKRHKHPDVAQQRFPDLSKGGKINPPPNQALESKGSTRPWALQSHYNHGGWYIVWRYAIDPTKSIKDRAVAIWRVDIPFLTEGDWKYRQSLPHSHTMTWHFVDTSKQRTRPSNPATSENHRSTWSGPSRTRPRISAEISLSACGGGAAERPGPFRRRFLL